MKRQSTIFAMLIIAAALVMSGCSDSGTAGDGHSKSILSRNNYSSYPMTLQAKDLVSLTLDTDGLPVDVLLLDTPSFNGYKSTVDGSSAAWTALVSRLNVNATALNYSVNDAGTYYIVIDNTGVVPGGADGTRDILVNVTYEYT